MQSSVKRLPHKTGLAPLPRDHSCYQPVLPLLPSFAQLNLEGVRTPVVANILASITCSWSDLCLRGYVCMLHVIRLAYLKTLRAYLCTEGIKVHKETSAPGGEQYTNFSCAHQVLTVTIIQKKTLVHFREASKYTQRSWHPDRISQLPSYLKKEIICVYWRKKLSVSTNQDFWVCLAVRCAL